MKTSASVNANDSNVHFNDKRNILRDELNAVNSTMIQNETKNEIYFKKKMEYK